MAAQHTILRQTAPAERKPAGPAPVRAKPTPAPTAVQLLQRRLGNQGAAALVARSAMRVSSPHDPAEREATAKAAEVMRMPSSPPSPISVEGAGVHRCACDSCACGPEAQRQATQAAGPQPGNPPAASPEVSREIQADMAAGAPLPGPVRAFMEPRFNADFGKVRVHTGARAAELSNRLNAHAFTVGNHVFFGEGQYRPETAAGKELIAHELTHTIQQGGSVQRSAVSDGTLIQRDEKKSWWQRFKDTIADWGESAAWDMVHAIAPPEAIAIIRKGVSGVVEWVEEKISSAADSAFNALMAPVRAIAGVGDTLSALFAPMLTSLKVAAVQISQNDCSPIRQAAEKIEKLALSIITPIVEKLQPVVAKVKGFLNDLWEKIGSPIWEFIKKYAKFQWDALMWWVGVIKDFYAWIWRKTEWIRAAAEKAWEWLKNKLGIGSDNEDGILQWVQRKAEAAWDVIKAKIEPFKKELTAIGLAVGGVVLMLSPIGPVMAIGAAVAGAIQGIRWVAANWGKGDVMVKARLYLEKTLIPPLVNAVKSLAASVTRMAMSIAGALMSVAAAMTRAVGTLGGSIFRFLVGAIEWLADQAHALANWANRQLNELAVWLTGALGKLQTLLKQMLHLLKRVGETILDIYGLPFLLGEEIWNMIPACIRDPIVDFLGPIILRQIELFSELGKDNDAWQKTKADVMKIIHLVFKDHDLVGAVKAVFHLILRVFNVPPELLVKIGQQAMAAWDVVSKKPIEFIKNTVRSIGVGFRLLWENLWDDLLDGLQGWLFGELKEKKINPPASWTNPKDLFFLALEVLGLTVDHMWELLAKRFDKDKVAAVRKRFGQVMRIIDWINNSIDLTKSPKENAQGIWDQAKDFAGTILTGIAEWVASKVAEELAIMATAAAASGGLSEVLDVLRRVYKALVTAKRYANQILQMISKGLDYVLDIAGGKVEKVGVLVHKLMKMGMPVVIGFLAEQVGLGGVGEEIRKIVDKLRTAVDDAILWFIDKIKAGLDALIGLLKAGVQKLIQWWKKEVPVGEGEEKHTLKFSGSGASAELVVQSKTKPLKEFVIDFLKIEGTAKEIAEVKRIDKEITATQKQLVAAEEKGDQAKVDKLSDTIEEQMKEMAVVLTELIRRGGGEEGGQKRPLLIDYPKRRGSTYQTIYIGPRVGEGVRVRQSSLRDLPAGRPAPKDLEKKKQQLLNANPELPATNKGLAAWGGEVQSFSPTGKGNIDGKLPDIGLAAEFANIVPGRLITYDKKESTGGGGKINDVFRPYGFSPKAENLDGDHVLERQLGGPDDYPNLWPLEASENRSSGATVKNLMVKYKSDDMTVHEAREKRGKPTYLLINTVRG